MSACNLSFHILGKISPWCSIFLSLAIRKLISRHGLQAGSQAYNEFVFVADTLADMQDPQGAGAVPSIQPALHLPQYSVQTLSDRDNCPTDKQCGDNHNVTTILIINAH